jgi:RNA polymerase sigma factor (sigma-70 family)
MSGASINHAPVPSAQADLELLRRYADGGDAEAFSELVRRYARFVFSVARRITGDSNDAEDVSQQCFLELARRAGTISGSVDAWLHRLAWSRSLNLRRDRATRLGYEHQSVATAQSGSASEPTWVELEPLIDDAIAGLHDELRVPLVLHYLQQKTQAEVAAECGVEQSTISRRLSHGIEALRERLREGGVLLSGTVLARQMQSVPVHIPAPGLIGSLTKIGMAGVGRTVAKTALVKWALALVALVTIGIAVTVLLQTRLGSRQPIPLPEPRVRAADDNPATTGPAVRGPAANSDRNEPGEGGILVARWDALLDDKSAGPIEALGTPQKSDSKLYQAMMFDAQALRGALAEARGQRDLFATARDVNFGKSRPWDKHIEIDPSFFINLIARTPKRVWLQSNEHSEAVFDRFDPPDQNSIHIVLNHPNLMLQLTELPQRGTPTTQPGEQAIMFDGALKPGEAVGFLATYTGASGTKYHHLVVWEAFRAEDWQTSSFELGASGIPTNWWIANGPQKMQALVDIALVWASRAKHAPDNPPSAFSVILPNGAGVKLLGLSRPSKFNFCWWDPAGDPIAAPMGTNLSSFGRRDTGLHYTAAFHESTTEPFMPMPIGRNRPIYSQWRMFSTGVWGSGLTFILGEGPWKKIGELNEGQPLQVDKITYTITSKNGDANYVEVEYSRSASSNDVMALTAVLADGSEIGSDPDSLNEGTDNRNGGAFFSNLSAYHVKTFHLWLRKGHVVRFTDFAESPNGRPPATVTHDQVVAAAAVLRAQQPASGQ